MIQYVVDAGVGDVVVLVVEAVAGGAVVHVVAAGTLVKVVVL